MNLRSDRPLLDDKSQVAHRSASTPPGEAHVHCSQYDNEYAEAREVKSRVVSLIRSARAAPREIAVLFRKTSQAKVLEEEMIKAGDN